MHLTSDFYPSIRFLAAAVVVAFLVMALMGCLEPDDSSSDDSVSEMTFADFRKALEEDAKPDSSINDAESAADCGHLAFEADTAGSNCCVAENFTNFLPFFVSMDEQQRSHENVLAFSRNAQGVVYQYQFKQDLDGRGRVNNGGFQRAVCSRAELVENACSASASRPFTCMNPID